METKTVLVTNTEIPLNPCQLKKLWGTQRIACTFDCAIEHGCPITYVDEHNRPILRNITLHDLLPVK